MAVDFENDLLVVTCASGKQASHLLPRLEGQWKRLRLQAHSETSIQRLQQQYPSAQIVQADMDDPKDAARVLDGATAIYHVGPSFHRHETHLGYTMIDAAVAESRKPGAKFQHFVYSSVIQSQLRKLLNHDVKRYVEEYLQESGLNFTILQPSHFLNNFPLRMLARQDEPVYQAPYNLRPKYSFTILEDYAEAAANVFAERERHYFAQYALVSTYPIPYTQIIADASQMLGKEIKVEQLPFEQAVDSMYARLFGTGDVDPMSRDALERMLLYYNQRGIVGSPTVMEMVLGKPPAGHLQWMKTEIENAESRT